MNTHTIELTDADLELLGRLLPEHPYKLVAPLISKINAQLAAEQKPKDQNHG